MCKILKGRRKEEPFIMDHVIPSTFSKSKINIVNKVWLYLEVETVAKIFNFNETKIEQRWL